MIPLETIIGWGGTAVVIGGHVFIANYRINENARQLEAVWKWKDDHSKEAVDIRMSLQKEMGELSARSAVHDANYSQILLVLSEIKNDLNDLKNRKIE